MFAYIILIISVIWGIITLIILRNANKNLHNSLQKRINGVELHILLKREEDRLLRNVKSKPEIIEYDNQKDDKETEEKVF